MFSSFFAEILLPFVRIFYCFAKYIPYRQKQLKILFISSPDEASLENILQIKKYQRTDNHLNDLQLLHFN